MTRLERFETATYWVLIALWCDALGVAVVLEGVR
jgi:hypothetical protein